MAQKRYPPSAKKLKKARAQGDVAKSRDLTGAIALITGSAWIYWGYAFPEAIIELIGKNFVTSADFSTEIMLLSLLDALATARIVLLPLLFAVFVVVFIVEGLQAGFQVSFEPLTPDFSRLGLSKNISKIFGGGEEEVFGLRVCTSIAKFVLLVFGFGLLCAAIVFFCVVEWVNADRSLVHGIAFAFELNLTLLLGIICALTLLFGVSDSLIQRARRQKRLRMSADELKQEYKETDGNPEIKDSQRRLHQEVVLNQFIQGVRKAKVLLTGRG
jgi:flagellar biosynthesis protein FlhB